MIGVSNDFKTRTKKIKQQNIKLGIVDGELTVKEVHFMTVKQFNALPVWMLKKRQEVIAKELKYSFEGNLFKTIMKQIEITVKNAGELKDKNVKFQYGLYINNNFEYIDLGDYYIKDIEDDKGKSELVVTGYDKMIHFMKTFKQSELQLTYPCTMLTLIQKMCEICGVELYSTNFFNANLQVDEDYFTTQELTYRDVLEKVAQSTLTTIFIKDNKLYLHKLADNVVQKIDESYLTGLTIKEKFGPVNVLVLGRGDVEDNVEAKDDTSITQNGRCEIRFDENEFVEYQREQVIGEMFEEIKGLEYYSFEGSDVGVMWLEPCDLIEVEDTENSIYKTIYLSASITINTGIGSDIEANIPEETDTEYKVTTKEEKKTLKVERLAKKNEGLIQDLIEETTEQGQKLTEVEQTVDGITQTVSSVETKIETVEDKAENAQSTANEIKSQTIYAVDVMYALSSSETQVPTSGWQTTAPSWENGKYMWQKTVITYGNGSTEESSATCITGAKGQNGEDGIDGTNGADGAKGDTGIGVAAIVEEYYLSNSNTTQTGGSWKTTQDNWVSGKYIWTRNKITWTDDTISYTEPVLATGLNNANSVANTANNTANTANTTANEAKNTVEDINNNLATNYYTKTETNSQIEQTASSITSSVSQSISTAKQEAINSANSSTDEKLQDYSTTSEMNSAITQKANSITQEVNQKIGKDEIIAMLNLAIENGQGVIAISGNQVTIDSDNFTLDKTGKITATSGKIGGFTLGENVFEADLTLGYSYTNDDIERLTKILSEEITATDLDYEKYDLDNSGELDALDLYYIIQIINNQISKEAKFILDTSNSKKAIQILDADTNQTIVNLGRFGSYIQSLKADKIQVKDNDVSAKKTIYSNQSGTTGTIELTEDISNYDYIEIIYADDWGNENSVKTKVINGVANFIMTTNKIGSGTSQTASSIANVSGNYLSYNGDYSGSYTSWNNSISMGNNIRVKHVLGWN